MIADVSYKRIKGLREWNFGDLEAEGEHLNPPLPYGDFFVQFGSVDEREFQHRINTTITELTKESSGKNILMVSHGAVIAQFYRYWLEHSDVRRNGRIQNCSIFHYHFKDDVFVLQEIIEHDFSELEV